MTKWGRRRRGVQTTSRARVARWRNGCAAVAALGIAACSRETVGPFEPHADAGDAAPPSAPPPENDASFPPSPEVEAGLRPPEASTASDAGTGADTDAAPAGELGTPCREGSECRSGHCSESVCCDTECNRYAQACNTAGAIGTCVTSHVLHVDPEEGDDLAKGLESAPLRTLTRALLVVGTTASATSPWTVRLHDGTYTADGGETWPVIVPDGVTVQAVNTGKAVLLGTPDVTGLAVDGSVSLEGFAAKNFHTAVLALRGPVRVEALQVEGGGGFSFARDVAATVHDATLRDLTGIGIEASEHSLLEVTGGSMTRSAEASGCERAVGIQISTELSASIDGMVVRGFAAGGVVAANATVKIARSTFDANGDAVCKAAQIAIQDRTMAALESLTVLNGTAIGIDVSGVVGGPDVTLKDSMLSDNYVGVQLRGYRGLQVRSSQITGSFIGIYAPAAEDQVVIDLGRAGSPGDNVVRGSNRALVLMGAYDPILVMSVAGNRWNPGVDGADAEGRYPGMRALVSPQHAPGGNFYAPNVKLGL